MNTTPERDHIEAAELALLQDAHAALDQAKATVQFVLNSIGKRHQLPVGAKVDIQTGAIVGAPSETAGVDEAGASS